MDTDQRQWLARQFEGHRSHLHSVAYRMLGSAAEADDAIQEAWLRLDASDSDAVRNLGGWLTTVVGRVCLDMLRTRKSRREVPVNDATDDVATHDRGDAPDERAILADSVGLALLVILETLRPSERVAFVLHDMFDVPFNEIGAMIECTPNTAAQLASRARRRVRGRRANPTAAASRQREIVDAFVVAARSGNLEALVDLLHPDVTLTVDAAAAAPRPARSIRGAADVAAGSGTFAFYAHHAEVVLVDTSVGLVVAPGGRLRHVLAFVFDEDDKITEIDVRGDPDRLAATTVEMW